ncbi:peptidylprolyl isomerase [Gilvimarinus chinensis]|uniref:peptidylprolyl isomerase n=1 Tax=Gilvimarinus chinensis TaxID=396005 RepID=UPI00039AFD12|nr:peptidylprolyl isomerase [Gilvimarinus chinensis]
MSVRQLGLIVAGLFLPAIVMAAEKDDVLAQYEEIKVTQDDMRRYLQFYLPEENRSLALKGNLHQYVGNILMMRALALQAERNGLGIDSEQLAWQQEYQSVVWQVKAYQDHLIQEAQKNVNWDARAKELYLAEPERFYTPDKVNASHILIQTKDRSDEEAQALISSIRQRALDGESFSELAKEYSDDKGSRKKGGNLGAFDSTQMVPEFSEAAFALQQPGDVSGVVKTQFGYHVILLNEKIPGSKKPYEKVKSQLIEELKERSAKSTVEATLTELRSEVYSRQLNTEAANELRAEYGLEPLPELSPED